jgi:hypothetical protein
MACAEAVPSFHKQPNTTNCGICKASATITFLFFGPGKRMSTRTLLLETLSWLDSLQVDWSDDEGHLQRHHSRRKPQPQPQHTTRRSRTALDRVFPPNSNNFSWLSNDADSPESREDRLAAQSRLLRRWRRWLRTNRNHHTGLPNLSLGAVAQQLQSFRKSTECLRRWRSFVSHRHQHRLKYSLHRALVNAVPPIAPVRVHSAKRQFIRQTAPRLEMVTKRYTLSLLLKGWKVWALNGRQCKQRSFLRWHERHKLRQHQRWVLTKVLLLLFGMFA